MKPYTYLLVNIACISIPFMASFYKKHAFYKDWKPFFKANIIVATVFIIWDYYFTKAGIWGFNPDYLTGFYVANLPIEEVLFFISIPYACVFSYFAFKYLVQRNPFDRIERFISYFLIVVLLVLAGFNFDKSYTFLTFLSTALLLLYLRLKKTNLSYHYLSYCFIFPFFFISNGILTGSFLTEPIVWYNNSENLGIRLANIPVEDAIYGLLLIFLNIEIYRFFKSREQKNHL